MKMFIVLLVAFLLLTRVPAFAQEVSSDSAGLSTVPTIDYTLPYPGILPDNPLYPLKAFRDRMVSLLIVDPVKKSLFNLLQADKRLQSAVYLLYNGDLKRIQLAETTISKGENYFEESVAQIVTARSRGRHVSGEISRLAVAAAKHQEVLTQLQSQVPESEKDSFNHLKERMTKIQQTIATIQKKK